MKHFFSRWAGLSDEEIKQYLKVESNRPKWDIPIKLIFFTITNVQFYW